MFTRIRPGFIEYLFTSIDLETFDLDYELKNMRLDIQSPWNGTMTKEKYELVSTPQATNTRGSVNFKDLMVPIPKESSDLNKSYALADDSAPHTPGETIGAVQSSLISEMEYFKGCLAITQIKDKSLQFISTDEDSIFYNVPKRILSFIDGCPSKVTHIEITADEENERLIFCATEVEEEKTRYTISVSLDKILKLTEVEGVKKNEDSLLAIRSRQALIVRAISSYLKRFVQILEYDPQLMPETEMLLPGHMPTFNNKSRGSTIKKKPDQECDDGEEELLFMLINNEGNQIRRPKMSIKLLTKEASED